MRSFQLEPTSQWCLSHASADRVVLQLSKGSLPWFVALQSRIMRAIHQTSEAGFKILSGLLHKLCGASVDPAVHPNVPHSSNQTNTSAGPSSLIVIVSHVHFPALQHICSGFLHLGGGKLGLQVLWSTRQFPFDDSLQLFGQILLPALAQCMSICYLLGCLVEAIFSPKGDKQQAPFASNWLPRPPRSSPTRFIRQDKMLNGRCGCRSSDLPPAGNFQQALMGRAGSLNQQHGLIFRLCAFTMIPSPLPSPDAIFYSFPVVLN
ncbi:predicted protein [Histoplasma capsulatum H143]|uniref:Uncharacterized protein n=1 Tax=Ajellomyces capsulatus (strain H143) TaxID=544712 RepID=C6HFI6_AJECH|nr:predicted protein [Histoplasma capsulatum H143]